jgi:hypothetical protein
MNFVMKWGYILFLIGIILCDTSGETYSQDLAHVKPIKMAPTERFPMFESAPFSTVSTRKRGSTLANKH